MVVRADGKDELSGWEALADVGFGNRLVGRVSLAERETWKVRLSGREALAGVRQEVDARCVGQVKTEK